MPLHLSKMRESLLDKVTLNSCSTAPAMNGVLINVLISTKLQSNKARCRPHTFLYKGCALNLIRDLPRNNTTYKNRKCQILVWLTSLLTYFLIAFTLCTAWWSKCNGNTAIADLCIKIEILSSMTFQEALFTSSASNTDCALHWHTYISYFALFLWNPVQRANPLCHSAGNHTYGVVARIR